MRPRRRQKQIKQSTDPAASYNYPAADTTKRTREIQIAKKISPPGKRTAIIFYLLIITVVCFPFVYYRVTEYIEKTKNPVQELVESEHVVELKSTEDSEENGYSDLSNDLDISIDGELRQAEQLVEDNRYEDALLLFENILKSHPNSPRAMWGKYLSTDKKAEAKRSNAILEQAIAVCLQVLDLPDVPRKLLLKVGRKCAERQKFRGWNMAALNTYRRLYQIFPKKVHLLNEAGVAGLLGGKTDEAMLIFQEVLQKAPQNGFAKVHLGFIYKTKDNDIKSSIPLMQEGIDSLEDGVVDGRFFFHLGDSYYRDGQQERAYQVYTMGAEKGLFPSMWQRSLYNVDRLSAKPWWTYWQTGNAEILMKIEKHWKAIRDEGLAQLDPSTGSFKPEDENLREKGDWKQFTLYSQGRKNDQNCQKAPKTCQLIEDFPDAKSCSRGQVKFSVMHGGVHVWPHCGPTNCRIRAHLGLVVPEGPRIRVKNETKTWVQGKFIIFDDSFEHEVWHDGNSTRLVLIIDMWHPELTQQERRSLSPI